MVKTWEKVYPKWTIPQSLVQMFDEYELVGLKNYTLLLLRDRLTDKQIP